MVTLQEITGYESGAVVYEDGSVWVGNWSSIDGIPRQFATGDIGLGEDVAAMEREDVSVPETAIDAMIQHEADQGVDFVARTGYLAIRLPVAKVTVVTHEDWA